MVMTQNPGLRLCLEDLIKKELRRKISSWYVTHVCLFGVRDSWVRTMVAFLQVPLLEGSQGRKGTNGKRHLLPTTHMGGAASQISTWNLSGKH